MSKNNTAGGGGKTDTDEQDEDFVAVEVDESGKPIGQQQEQQEREDDDDLERDDDDHEPESEPEERDDDEQRLGHMEGEQDETPEERRARRSREQRAKRVRNRVTAEAKDRLIQNQGRMLLTLQEQVAQLQGRTIQYDVNLLQSQLSQVESQQSDAKAVLAKLVKANDGEGVAEITELQMQLRDQHRQLTEKLRRARDSKKGRSQEAGEEDAGGEGGPPPQQTRRGPAPDPEVIRRAQAWISKYKWADPRTGDPEEVQIIKAIDQNLNQEGWDPRSEDYWAEMTSRTKRRLPHHFKKPSPNGEGRGESRVNGDNGGRRPAQGGPRMAPASQSGGASRPLGKNEVRVTPQRKAAMQAAGKWDDPEKRKRMLAAYAKHDRENAGQQ